MTLDRITLICRVILLLYFIYLDFTVSKMKKENKPNLEMIESIITLEKAMKKLNEALKIHEFRLDHQRDERYAIKKRLDILEEGHPDTDIDYGEVDDQSNVVCVWFHGKKYVPEDKRDDYLASDAECDELLKRVERLNRIYDAGLMSLSEYGERLKEWMQNDS